MPGAPARAGAGAAPGPRLRRLPHRPPRGRWRAPEPEAAARPGHQIVGTVEAAGEGAERFAVGRRVGVPWLGWTDGELPLLPLGPREPVRARPVHRLPARRRLRRAGGRRRALLLPDPGGLPGLQAAPLLCAGLIGYRSLRLGGDARAARPLRLRRRGPHHLPGGRAPGPAGVRASHGRATPRPSASRCELGAEWAGRLRPSRRPEPLDAAIIFAPVGELVPVALRAVRPGGTVVCAGIHMSDIPSFPYEILWGERSLRSVANLTRRDGEEFLALAPRGPGANRGGGVPAGAGQRGPRRPARR